MKNLDRFRGNSLSFSINFNEANFSHRYILICGILVAYFLAFSSVALGHTPVFGPRSFTRVSGPPNTFRESFNASILQGTFTLIIENGDASGNRRITDASIRLNGQEV